MKIKITCDGQKYMPIDDFQYFQGDLKASTRAKSLIKKYGFSFPVFIWKKKIIDGHRRILATKELIDEGYELEKDIPTCEIHAKNATEAAKKLLMENSKFGRITEDGLYEFSRKYNISAKDIPELKVPDIDMDVFMEMQTGNEDGGPQEPAEAENNYAEQYGVIVICDDESSQEETYNSLTESGYKCRVVNT